MIAGSERQLVAQARHLGPLGLGQILLVIGKQRAGVEQVVIQKVGIKFVAEVVMGGDVLPRLGAGVAAGPVAQAGDGLAQQTKAALQTPQHLAVAREDLQQRRQLVALPVAVHPCLGRRQLPPVSRRQYTSGVQTRASARSAAAGSPNETSAPLRAR